MSIEAMKQALEALEDLQGLCSDESGFIEQVTIWTPEAITALRTAIEQTEKQTPVAYRWKGELFTPSEIEMLDVDDAVPLYQNPQPVECMCGICKLGKREWVGLTNEEIEAVMHGSVEGERMLPYQFARAIEAKLKAKNEAP
jgi:hypothetical protein